MRRFSSLSVAVILAAVHSVSLAGGITSGDPHYSADIAELANGNYHDHDSDDSYNTGFANVSTGHEGASAGGRLPLVANVSSIEISAAASCGIWFFLTATDISLGAAGNSGFLCDAPIQYELSVDASWDAGWDAESANGDSVNASWIGDASMATTGLGLNLGYIGFNSYYGDPWYDGDSATHRIVGTANSSSYSLNPGAQLMYTPSTDDPMSGVDNYANTSCSMTLSATVTSTAMISGKGDPIFAMVVGNGTTLRAYRDDKQNLQVGHLTIEDSGQLDLDSTEITVLSEPDLSPLNPLDPNSVAGQVARAYHGGAWDGHGLTSSAARSSAGRFGLGYRTVAVEAKTTAKRTHSFPSAVLVKYVLNGDCNLDGRVDGLDLLVFRKNYNQPGVHTWSEGDFNYDGRVDVSDQVMLMQNIYQSAGH